MEERRSEGGEETMRGEAEKRKGGEKRWRGGEERGRGEVFILDLAEISTIN